MSNLTVENGAMTQDYNIKMKLSNNMGPEKQWWAIESVLAAAEKLGQSPVMKQINDPAKDSVVIFFSMSEEQKNDFFKRYPTPKKSA